MATQRPVVVPGSNQLRWIDSTGIPAGSHRNVPLGPGVYRPAQMSGEIIAVVESSAGTRNSP